VAWISFSTDYILSSLAKAWRIGTRSGIHAQAGGARCLPVHFRLVVQWLYSDPGERPTERRDSRAVLQLHLRRHPCLSRHCFCCSVRGFSGCRSFFARHAPELRVGDTSAPFGTHCGISFTGLEQHDTCDYNEHDSHEEDPRYRRDEPVSAIWANTEVQTKFLLTGWARFHQANVCPAFL
jgi:hypothetical protein